MFKSKIEKYFCSLVALYLGAFIEEGCYQSSVHLTPFLSNIIFLVQEGLINNVFK